MTSRRAFLKTASAAALAAPVVHPFLAWAADPSPMTVPGKDGMIVRSYRFLDLETPVEFNSSRQRMIVHSEAVARVGLDKTFLREL